MEDNHRLKTVFNGSPTLMEDNLQLKAPFDGGHLLIKTTVHGGQLFIEYYSQSYNSTKDRKLNRFFLS